jgi:hypothetical protein
LFRREIGKNKIQPWIPMEEKTTENKKTEW